MGAQTSRTAENVEEFESFLQSEKLAKATHDKLLDMYKDYRQSFTELKKEHDCLKVNTDQKIFELESRVKSGEESVHTEASIKQANNEQIKKLEKRLAESSKKLQELQCNLDESSRARNEFERKAQLLEAEKSELSSVLQSKEKDMQRMQSDWKAQSEELSKANTLRISALAQLNEAESLKLTAEQKEVRVVKEKQQLEKQNAWLEDQLQTKVNELLGLRREQLKKTMDLESALNTKTEELGRVQSLLDTMTETQEQKDAKLETYMQKLKEAKDLQAEMEEQYGNEIHAQAKLVELYKSSYSEQKNKVEEMMAALEEVKKLLQESTDAGAAQSVSHTVEHAYADILLKTPRKKRKFVVSRIDSLKQPSSPNVPKLFMKSEPQILKTRQIPHNKKTQCTQYVCPYCALKCTNRQSLHYHKKSKHPTEKSQEPSVNRIQCYKCKTYRCRTTKQLIEHLNISHEEHIEIQNATLASSKEFYEWKSQLEKSHCCNFMKAHGDSRNYGYVKANYYCNRTGNFRPRGKTNRAMKSQGTCKLSTHCTAFISSFTNIESGEVEVEYCVHHIHDIDAAHLKISDGLRSYIAENLAKGIDTKLLLDDIRCKMPKLQGRDRLIKHRDILNIKSSLTRSEWEPKLEVQKEAPVFYEEVETSGLLDSFVP